MSLYSAGSYYPLWSINKPAQTVTLGDAKLNASIELSNYTLDLSSTSIKLRAGIK
jgi:hypothetical protein